MRRLSLREAQQASRFHGLAAVQERKLLERMGGGTPGASTPRVLISGKVPAPGLLGSLESEPLPSIALRVPHPLGGREILLAWGVRSRGGHRTALQGT